MLTPRLATPQHELCGGFPPAENIHRMFSCPLFAPPNDYAYPYTLMLTVHFAPVHGMTSAAS